MGIAEKQRVFFLLLLLNSALLGLTLESLAIPSPSCPVHPDPQANICPWMLAARLNDFPATTDVISSLLLRLSWRKQQGWENRLL